AIAATVLYALREEGRAATHCLTAGEALLAADAEAVDLAILDVGLPDLSGSALCRKLREGRDRPVIFQARSEEEPDRLSGFALGADDYVPTPFSRRVLVARVQAVLRRVQAGGDVAARAPDAAGFEHDSERLRVRYRGHMLELIRY